MNQGLRLGFGKSEDKFEKYFLLKGEPLEKRPDDNVDALTKRLESYHTQTSPLVNYYAKKGLHRAVDASQDSSSVFNSVVAAIDNLKQKVKMLKLFFKICGLVYYT